MKIIYVIIIMYSYQTIRNLYTCICFSKIIWLIIPYKRAIVQKIRMIKYNKTTILYSTETYSSVHKSHKLKPKSTRSLIKTSQLSQLHGAGIFPAVNQWRCRISYAVIWDPRCTINCAGFYFIHCDNGSFLVT